MSAPVPAWVRPYIGLPYRDKGRGPDAWDCWGGVRMVLADVFGVRLPDYADAYTTADDSRSVARAVTTGLEDGWACIGQAAVGAPAFWWRGLPILPGDLLVLRVGGRPWHCALMVTAERFLHWLPPAPDGTQSFSCIERLDSPRWAKRIDGFWRCTLPNRSQREEAA